MRVEAWVQLGRRDRERRLAGVTFTHDVQSPLLVRTDPRERRDQLLDGCRVEGHAVCLADVLVDTRVEAHAAMTGETAAADRAFKRQGGDVGLPGADIDDQVSVGSAKADARAHSRGQWSIEQVGGASAGQRSRLEQRPPLPTGQARHHRDHHVRLEDPLAAGGADHRVVHRGQRADAASAIFTAGDRPAQLELRILGGDLEGRVAKYRLLHAAVANRDSGGLAGDRRPHP